MSRSTELIIQRRWSQFAFVLLPLVSIVLSQSYVYCLILIYLLYTFLEFIMTCTNDTVGNQREFTGNECKRGRLHVATLRKERKEKKSRNYPTARVGRPCRKVNFIISKWSVRHWSDQCRWWVTHVSVGELLLLFPIARIFNTFTRQ